MSQNALESFAQLVQKNLKDNGFPAKKVALPLEKLYEAAENKDINFNDVLKLLEEENISHEKTLDKIIFSAAQASLSKADMLKQAQEMMGQMTPEQIQEMQNLFQNMSAEEKEEIMRKGAEMGLI